MAGNKKPRKASKGIKRETFESKTRVMRAGIAARGAKKAKQYDRNMGLSQLPMGHPINAYVLDWTFAPIHKMLDDSEATGGHMFGEDGLPVMWVERDQVYTPVIEACLEISDQFRFTADEFGWGEAHTGLLAYGLKLARGERLDEQDVADARAALAWMREKLATINCFQWAHSMQKMEAQDKAQKEAA